jgi:hypothetical protein
MNKLLSLMALLVASSKGQIFLSDITSAYSENTNLFTL